MIRSTQISIPTFVRIKPGTLDRLGEYASRINFDSCILLTSEGLRAETLNRVRHSFELSKVKIVKEIAIENSSAEQALQIFKDLPNGIKAIFGVGGGKALDVAKYVSFLSRLPYIAAPTALSNDGFCSPQSSLEVDGKRRSLPATMPYGVIIDTEVCLQAPNYLWWSGIGDLSSKITAVYDWKLAYHKQGTFVDDFAALLSDATVFQLMSRKEKDLESIQLLGTALMLNGIAMEICGSSRPASGSEHLLSHALDIVSKKPRLHGIQVGVAAYIMSILQQQGTEHINKLFQKTGFWQAFDEEKLLKSEWISAFELAPTIKDDFYTILSEKDFRQEFKELLDTDPKLKNIFL
ncbi:MAG: iron-containing alcohol dehydrogenase family protein [Candidatus Margulisbacteria bacterium]|nr:iron-containing alcohol dehydrogenase family protein [Candidatus Margulisiibacteriota bacterium]